MKDPKGEAEFLTDLHLDPDALDVECLRQAENFYKWGQRLATAKSEVDRLELQRDVVESTLSIEVRRNPEKFRLDKATDASVKAAVQTSPRYVQACEVHLDARRESALLEKAVAAMEMKKRMLENLVTLHGQSYFAGPKVERDLAKAYKKFTDQVGDGQRKLARKRKERDDED